MRGVEDKGMVCSTRRTNIGQLRPVRAVPCPRVMEVVLLVNAAEENGYAADRIEGHGVAISRSRAKGRISLRPCRAVPFPRVIHAATVPAAKKHAHAANAIKSHLAVHPRCRTGRGSKLP